MKATTITLFLTVSLALSALAETFVVDNIFDPGSGVCDADGCTLREAIAAANANPGADIINFDIPGAGVHTISPTSGLPAVTEAVTIDGYTQPGTSENTMEVGDDAVLLIELNGVNVGSGFPFGLYIAASGCTIRGLVINRFLERGIEIEFVQTNTTIEGNFIGTDPSGTLDLGNALIGILVNGNDNLIGGVTPAARNVISGNGISGVTLLGAGNQVMGNYIGTDKTGTADLGNSGYGVTVFAVFGGSLVGGSGPGAGNLVSGNDLSGVYLTSADEPSIVQGNFIGTDATGTIALPNAENGVFIEGGGDNLIGGTETGAGNLISGNVENGVGISDSATGNTVQGNFIGTDVTGTLALGNLDGVEINAASANTIGGLTAAARNIISGNDNGVSLSSGASANTVQGNHIGTDVSGSVDLANASNGVLISDSPANILGGPVAGAGNLISGNGFGVQVSSAGATGNVIQGNFIGTDAAGTAPIGNVTGILLFTDVIGTTVGGPGAAGNTIAFNGSGVTINSSSSGNRVFGNSIFANEGIGIDLGGGIEDANFVTANDFPDSDSGANNLQNYPVINSIAVSGSDRTVEGELASNPNTDYVLDFYSNSEVDPSGFGEGETYLGFLDVHTNAQGRVDFSFPLDASANGQFITATATDPGGNTSEFSKASAIVPGAGDFLNISTRLAVGIGDNVLIGGFIITGTEPKKVLLRGIGPSLAPAVQGVLANPTIELHEPDGTVITNNNWRDTQEQEIIDTTIPPANNLESAIVATLDPGAYTVILRGVNDGTGIGLIETYDLDQTVNSQLGNISTRGLVQTGDKVMIGGIIIGPTGAAAASVLVRAIGPSLADLGIQNPLGDPTLELHDGNGALIASNDNWRSTQEAEIEATGIAPTDDQESAILATLGPGAYTAIVLGAGGTIGVGLVEAYQLD